LPNSSLIAFFIDAVHPCLPPNNRPSSSAIESFSSLSYSLYQNKYPAEAGSTTTQNSFARQNSGAKEKPGI
jgi:hypothetical protein